MRAILLAMLASIGLAFVINASPAGAVAPTLPPIIFDEPTDPSTTGPATFEIGPDPADAGDVEEIRCRVAAADPPTYQANCWTPEDGASATYIAQNVPNGPVTFQVQGKDAGTGFGPVATYTWTQNIAAPTAAPVFTETPPDGNTEIPTDFAFEAGAGDEGKVAGFQCRVDSDDPADFIVCNKFSPLNAQNLFPFGTRKSYRIGNGSHTLDVRSKTGVETGPFARHTWTNDVPTEINPSIALSDAEITQWQGDPGDSFGTSGQVFNSTQNAGDVNGDGINDLLAGAAETMTEALILFSTEQGLGTRAISSFGPELGYAMKSVENVRSYDVLGNINGDDVPDFVAALGYSGIYAVVYGVADPAGLPKCTVGPGQKRCIDLDDLSDDQGFYINVGGGNFVSSAGDFDGDGLGDIQATTVGSQTVVIKGAARTGTVDPALLPASETFTAIGGGTYGLLPSQEVGDLNGDGKDDIYNGDLLTGFTWIINGRAFGSPSLDLVSDFNESDGLKVASPPFAFFVLNNVGDVNGDGRPDLTFGSPLTTTLLYGPEQPTDEFLLPDDPGSNGYSFDPGSEGISSPAVSDFGVAGDAAGDFNNDGVPDQVFGAPKTSYGALDNTGAGYIMFGQRPAPEDGLVTAGSDLTPQFGVGILGEEANVFDGLGTGVAALGDVTGDDVGDFAVVDSGDAVVDDGGGDVYIVSGGKILANARTNASAITKETATLNAAVVTSGRDTEVSFEYGKTDTYGTETPTQNVEGSSNAGPVEANLTGLSATTTYHYRAVLTNSLGLTYYGDDQTFTTTNTGGPVVDPCISNPGAAGCSGFCAANPTAIGCPGYDYCAANPGKCSTGGKAKLAQLVASPKTIKVKRGKKGSISTIVTNAGGKVANGVKVCVKAPKKFIKVKRCLKVGKLGAGKTRVKTFKVTVRKKARKGKKLTLKFKASSNNAGAKSAKATIRVK